MLALLVGDLRSQMLDQREAGDHELVLQTPVADLSELAARIIAVADPRRDHHIGPWMLADADLVQLGIRLVAAHGDHGADRAHVVAAVPEGVLIADLLRLVRDAASDRFWREGGLHGEGRVTQRVVSALTTRYLKFLFALLTTSSVRMKRHKPLRKLGPENSCSACAG